MIITSNHLINLNNHLHHHLNLLQHNILLNLCIYCNNILNNIHNNCKSKNNYFNYINNNNNNRLILHHNMEIDNNGENINIIKLIDIYESRFNLAELLLD